MSSLYTGEFVCIGKRKVVSRGGGRLTISLPESLKDNVGILKGNKYSVSFWVHSRETDVIIRFKEIEQRE